MKCMICKKEFGKDISNAGIGYHLKKCYKDIDTQGLSYYSYNTIKNYPVFTKELLEDQYISKGRSPLEIAQEFMPDEVKGQGSYGRNAVIKMLRDWGIKQRGLKEAINSPRYKERVASTNIERYGGPNPLNRNSPARKKAENTIKEKYGIVNVFMLPDFYHRFNVNDSYIRKYGMTQNEYAPRVTSNWLHSMSPEEMYSFLRNSLLKGQSQSSLEAKVSDCLVSHGFSIETQFGVRNQRIKTQGCKDYSYFDIRIKDTNILIEINGDFWHMNPEKYKDTDINDVTHLTASEIWERDAKKNQQAIDQGFKVINLWEKNLEKNKDNLFDYILSEIKNQGGLDEIRSCKINRIDG